MRASPNVRAVFISPATQNPQTLLDDAPAFATRRVVESDAPTVLQNVLFARQVKRKTTKYELSLRRNDEPEQIGVVSLASRPDGLRKRIAFVAEALTGGRSGTLIYANGADEAEKIAFLLNQGSPREAVDPELAALADLSRKGVHPDYLLAPLVERGVAFHYGNMPSLIRSEIERLFKSGKIRFLVCTSTLIEGVNLSCRMIVLRGPRKGSGKHMLAHDFWNLAGRAGRWGDEFQGKIVCIDAHDENAWPQGVPILGRPGPCVDACLKLRLVRTDISLARRADREKSFVAVDAARIMGAPVTSAQQHQRAQREGQSRHIISPPHRCEANMPNAR